MDIALALYPRFTALDIVGPFQVLSLLPGASTEFVAEKTGPVVDHTGALQLVASRSFAEVTRPDVIVVPGGMADGEATKTDPLVQWIARVHPTTTWTTSVCTGATYLGLAGLLEGLPATTHWLTYRRLAALGAHPTEQRVVFAGKIITAAGVSSGIDMALHLAAALAGEEVAQAIQLAIEYDPQPPFVTGAASKASPELIRLAAKLLTS